MNREQENERLRGLLRELREITSEYAWDADLEARVDAALSQQTEQPVNVPEGWLIELGFDVLERTFRIVESQSHIPTIKVILPPCEPLDSSSWDLRDEIARRIGSMLATPNMSAKEE